MSYNMHGITTGNTDKVQRVNANSACFRWKIRNFKDTDRSAHLCIMSSPFKPAGSIIGWRLQLYPNGKSQKQNDFIVLAVDYVTMIGGINVAFELSIVNNDNEVMEAFKLKKELSNLMIDVASGYPRYVDGGHYRLIVRRSDVENPKNRMLKDNCLTISFDVTFPDPMVVPSISNKHDNENVKEERLKEFDNFGKLLENGKFSDITFVVGDKEIHVHKAILANRSPVFDAMFQHDMREKQKNVVEIVDIEYAVMMELFRFMYTGTVNDIEKVACGLLVAAEKYCLERLKSLCEKALLSNIKIDTVIRCFAAADACNLTDLRKRAFDFILNHAYEIIERDEFASLNPSLMREILRAVVPKKNK